MCAYVCAHVRHIMYGNKTALKTCFFGPLEIQYSIYTGTYVHTYIYIYFNHSLCLSQVRFHDADDGNSNSGGGGNIHRQLQMLLVWMTNTDKYRIPNAHATETKTNSEIHLYFSLQFARNGNKLIVLWWRTALRTLYTYHIHTCAVAGR